MSQPAARVGDTTSHGQPITGVGCPKVLIGGRPAWRMSDNHTCAIPNAPPPAGPGTPHGPGMVLKPGAICVLIGGKPATRMGDQITEVGAVQPPMVMNTIAMGCTSVLIGSACSGGGCPAGPD